MLLPIGLKHLPLKVLPIIASSSMVRLARRMRLSSSQRPVYVPAGTTTDAVERFFRAMGGYSWRFRAFLAPEKSEIGIEVHRFLMPEI